MERDKLGKRLCVVGAGAIGLVTTKNFLEQGFDVTTIEQNDYVGGLWHITDDVNQTSVLEGTRANLSKHGACFSDFPYPDDAALHPTAKQTIDYLESYADHFDLRKHIRFSTTVANIVRNEESRKWIITTQNTKSQAKALEEIEFDRLILCTSPQGKAVVPKLFQEVRLFEDEVIHSRQFKDPSRYHGKNVVVVGTSATAVDTTEFCRAAGAKKVYMSHRRAIRLLPRVSKGRAIDVELTRRLALVSSYIRAISPTFSDNIMSKMMRGLFTTTWPALADHPAFNASDLRTLPSATSTTPSVGEELATNLLDGSVESVHAIERFTGPKSMLLKDGMELHDIDAIICCTGYTFDFSILPDEVNPTNLSLTPPHLLSALRSSPNYHTRVVMPWAYRGLLSISHPDSLAFFGNTIYRRGAFPLYDAISMAVAQMWRSTAESGTGYPLPSYNDMVCEREEHYSFYLAELRKGDIRHTGLMNGVEFDQWLDRVAGTGIWDRLGWGWTGWKFWWSEREVWKLLMDGIDSPHALRLFESGRVGGRSVWPRALEEMRKANAEVEEGAERWRRENEAAKVKKG